MKTIIPDKKLDFDKSEWPLVLQTTRPIRGIVKENSVVFLFAQRHPKHERYAYQVILDFPVNKELKDKFDMYIYPLEEIEAVVIYDASEQA